MPLTRWFDASLKVPFVEMHGIISDEKILRYAETATTDAEIPRICHELNDLRRARVPAASTDSLRRLAAAFRDAERTPKGVKIAFVAPSDATYGIARMYQAFRAGSEAMFHVFREMGEARDWLGLPPEPEE